MFRLRLLRLRNSVVNAILQYGGKTGLDVILDFFIENAIKTVEVFGPWFAQGVAYYIGNEEHIELVLKESH